MTPLEKIIHILILMTIEILSNKIIPKSYEYENFEIENFHLDGFINYFKLLDPFSLSQKKRGYFISIALFGSPLKSSIL